MYLFFKFGKSKNFVNQNHTEMSNFRKLFAGLFFLCGLALAFSGCQKDLMTDPEATDSDIIKGQYIVVYHDGVQVKSEGVVTYEEGLAQMRTATLEMFSEYQVPEKNLGYVYSFALEGFSAELSDEAFIALRNDPRVKYIEPVYEVKAFLTTQTNATWGIDRVDQRALPLSTTYSYENTGLGVHAYIIDTGIRTSHEEFGVRAFVGFDAFGGNGQDGNGHGTHVAGTVGGATYGLAKQVSLVAVRVLDNDGSGSTAGVVAGMDWVKANHVKPAVANMSLGGGASTAIDDAVGRMYDAGVPVIVAAGNGNWLGIAANACYYSPARAPKAYTIGATVSTDAKASYSNYGDCVNLFAPGSSITSAWYTNNTATNTISGTSMATPHVVGAAALYLQVNPTATPQQVYDALTETSTKGIVSSSRTTNNHLLYTLGFGSGGGEDPPPAENVAPTASFTVTTNGLTASFNASGSSDSDGSIVSYAWAFGDGTTGSGVTTSRTYAEAGTYTVTLTVTDNEGATGTQSQSVTVTAPPSGGDNPPVINSFNATRSTSGPLNKANISWAVSDVDADLTTVTLQILSGINVIESTIISVSGSSASGSSQLKTRSSFDTVKIIVTDANGNSVNQTKNI